MHARGGLLHSEYFGDETANLLPVCSENMSDSGNFDSVLELSVKAGDREIPEVGGWVGGWVGVGGWEGGKRER